MKALFFFLVFFFLPLQESFASALRTLFEFDSLRCVRTLISGKTNLVFYPHKALGYDHCVEVLCLKNDTPVAPECANGAQKHLRFQQLDDTLWITDQSAVDQHASGARLTMMINHPLTTSLDLRMTAGYAHVERIYGGLCLNMAGDAQCTVEYAGALGDSTPRPPSITVQNESKVHLAQLWYEGIEMCAFDRGRITADHVHLEEGRFLTSHSSHVGIKDARIANILSLAARHESTINIRGRAGKIASASREKGMIIVNDHALAGITEQL